MYATLEGKKAKQSILAGSCYLLEFPNSTRNR